MCIIISCNNHPPAISGLHPSQDGMGGSGEHRQSGRNGQQHKRVGGQAEHSGRSLAGGVVEHVNLPSNIDFIGFYSNFGDSDSDT